MKNPQTQTKKKASCSKELPRRNCWDLVTCASPTQPAHLLLMAAVTATTPFRLSAHRLLQPAQKSAWKQRTKMPFHLKNCELTLCLFNYSQLLSHYL